MTRIIRKTDSIKLFQLSKKRVAAYARVSSERDVGKHSLAAQVSYYSEYIQKRQEWAFAGIYADEAITGTTVSRSEFQRLLTDCREQRIDRIITKSISRFARNTVTMLEVVRELKGLNIDIFFEEQNIHSLSGDGELMLTILSSFAQAESLSVSDNCKWRIRKRFAEGELVNLRFMYGYRVNKSEIVVNSEEAEIVRLIFNEYLDGLGCHLIAKKLRGLDMPRPRGGRWDSDTIHKIIRNEKYAGNSLLQKKFVKDHLSKTLIRNKETLPKYFAEDTHPAIIDVLTFQKAQELMTSKRQRFAGKTKSEIYPFTSKIICGNCGKNFKRRSSRGNIYWNCSTYLKFGKGMCYAKQIPEEVICSKSCEVLGLDAFEATKFMSRVEAINIPKSGELSFVLTNGNVIQTTWRNKSHSEVWSQDARRSARERRLTFLDRSNSK